MERVTGNDSDQPNPSVMEIIIGHQDLANEILVHLPPKSLAKFKCISKQFQSFLSDPYFGRRYSLLHPPSFSGLFLIPRYIGGKRPEIEYTPLNQNRSSPPSLNFLTSKHFQILRSCNGLLLCSSINGAARQHMTYHVCNPTTRQFVDLPRCPYMKNEFGLALAFDPVSSFYYKVICIQRLDKHHQKLSQISVYTSETGLWTSPVETFVAPEGIDFTHGVYCNGSIHWMKGIKSSRGIYFKVDNKCLELMPELPMKDHHKYYHEYFGQSQGYLHYVVTYQDLRCLEILEMNQDYSEWLIKFRVDLTALARKFPIMAREYHGCNLDMSYECDVLCVTRGRNKNRVKVLLSIPGEVIAYNHKKKTSWKVCDLKVRANERPMWYRVYSAYDYYETISSLI